MWLGIIVAGFSAQNLLAGAGNLGDTVLVALMTPAAMVAAVRAYRVGRI